MQNLGLHSLYWVSDHIYFLETRISHFKESCPATNCLCNLFGPQCPHLKNEGKMVTRVFSNSVFDDSPTSNNSLVNY